MNLAAFIIHLALIFSLASLGLIFLSLKDQNNKIQRTSIHLYLASSALLFLAIILLGSAFINHNFEYAYVYNNSSRDLGLLYRISGIWAGKSGSFLFWVFLLNISGIVLIKKEKNNPGALLSIIVMAQIWILIILCSDNPFTYIWHMYPEELNAWEIPADGAGLNPLLIDPWMVVHPPVLFAGYATSIIPYAYAITALLKTDSANWLKKARPWILFSMAFLGIGISLGGYWAYKVLGWGGYWGWDPVENSSLIPWLIVTALAHGIILQKRSGLLARTNIILAQLYFILVILSTFLTRSGILSNFSVHSFSEGGIYTLLLLFLCFFVAISIFFSIKGLRKYPENKSIPKTWSWQSLTHMGILAIIVFSVLILLGTTMPIVTNIFLEKPAPVTVNFYNSITIAIGIVILGLMVASITVISGLHKNKQLLIKSTLASCAASVLYNLYFKTNSPAPYVYIAISVFILILLVSELFKKISKFSLPGMISHIGLSVFVIGVIASGYHSRDTDTTLYLDTKETLGGEKIVFKGITDEEKSSLIFSLGEGKEAKEITTAYYIDRRTNSLYKEPYIKMGLTGDWYLIPGEYNPGGSEAKKLILKENEKLNIDSVTIIFTGLRAEGMKSDSPAVYADLIINGKKVSPGIKIKNGNRVLITKTIPGSKKKVSFSNFNVKDKLIEISISGDKADLFQMPPSLTVHLTHKALIWLVWLGTIIITVGVTHAFWRESHVS